MAQTLYLRLSQNLTMRKGRRNIPAAGDLPGDSASARYLAFYTVCPCCAKAFNHTYEVLFTSDRQSVDHPSIEADSPITWHM